MSGKLARAISLIVVIITGIAFCTLLWIGVHQEAYMIVPAVCFTGIYAWVLINEVWGATTGERITLSTRWKHWAAEHPVLSWTAIGLLWICILALGIHLGIFW